MDFEGKRLFYSLTPFRVFPGPVKTRGGLQHGCLHRAFLVRMVRRRTRPSKPPQVSDGDVFSRISLSVKKVQTMSSAFEQERHTAMLKDAMISSGRFFFAKPDKIRWETIDPSPAGFSVNGQEAKRWQGTSGSA